MSVSPDLFIELVKDEVLKNARKEVFNYYKKLEDFSRVGQEPMVIAGDIIGQNIRSTFTLADRIYLGNTGVLEFGVEYINAFKGVNLNENKEDIFPVGSMAFYVSDRKEETYRIAEVSFNLSREDTYRMIISSQSEVPQKNRGLVKILLKERDRLEKSRLCESLPEVIKLFLGNGHHSKKISH